MATRGCFVKYLFTGLLVLSFESCVSELFITHSPSHTQFLQGAGSLDLSELPKVVVSSFGLGLTKDLKWNGIAQGNLFKRPKAHCIVSVEGLQDGSIDPKHIAKYQVNNDVGSVNTELVRQRLFNMAQQDSLIVDFTQYNRMYDVRNQYPALFRDVPSSFTNIQAIFTQGNVEIMSLHFGSLNISQEADLGFLAEMLILRSVIHAVQSNPAIASDSHPDFLHFNIRTMQSLIEEYGGQSLKVKDAVALLEQVLEQLTSDLRTLYRDNVVVEVVTFNNDSPESLHRNVRSLMADDPAAPPATKTVQATLNVVKGYRANFAVYFNIILWLVIVLVLAITFIAYGIWFMDPGRDSIIYRMTSQRLKRE